MILVLKHLVLMSFALLLVPLCGLLFARAQARSRRLMRPGLSWRLAAWRLMVALVVPAVAQGLFAWTDWRFFSLTVAGALYGALFGNDEDFPLLPSVVWGTLAGLGTAWLYVLLPASGEGRALCVAVFAVTPILAYKPLTSSVRNRLTTSGVIVPSRRLLR